MTQPGHELVEGVHPQARVGGPPEDRGWLKERTPSHTPVIRRGAWINAFATVDAGTRRSTWIGYCAMVMAHAHIGHDAHVGDFADVATGAVIGGWVEIGDGAKIGLNATVLPHRRIGEDAVVGAGAVITRDVLAGEVWAGNPARKIADAKNPIPYSERRALLGYDEAHVRADMKRRP